MLSPGREYHHSPQRKEAISQPADPIAIAQRADAVVRAYDEATPPEIEHSEPKLVVSSARKSSASSAPRRKSRSIKGKYRSTGSRGSLKGPPLRVLAARSPRTSKRSPKKTVVLNDVARLYKTPKRQSKENSQSKPPSKNYKKKMKKQNGSKKKLRKPNKPTADSNSNPLSTPKQLGQQDSVSLLQIQEEEFERLQAERWSLEQQYSALMRTMDSMNGDEGMVGYSSVERRSDGNSVLMAPGSGAREEAIEPANSAADMIMSSPSLQPQYQPYQQYPVPYGLNQGLNGGFMNEQFMHHDATFSPMHADEGRLDYPSSSFEPDIGSNKPDANAASPGFENGQMMTPRFRSRSGLSHDSDAWRRISERRPRTAPPKGLDSESAVWSNQHQNAIFANQSYMVGEPTPRLPDRGHQPAVPTASGQLEAAQVGAV